MRGIAPCIACWGKVIPTHAHLLLNASLAGAGALAAGALLKNEHEGHMASERLAAAALETLLKAIDANDPETGAHVRRVAAYALLLAEYAGLSRDEERLVELVSLFHDIGKIHEALFDIIHEKTRLTRAERRAVLTHPQRGADVLAPLDAFYPELPDSVLAHHERWNGRGYPKQLKGKRIPLPARIVAIADTFDAITYRRRYSRGRSVAVARDIILEGRGTLFDPELVDLFVFPPVFAEVMETAREVATWTHPVQSRRNGRREHAVPEVTFRWRPVRPGERGPSRRD